MRADGVPVGEIAAELGVSMARDAHRFYELLNCEKHERYITESEGGEAHCAVNNRNLANQIEFDFPDEVFKR